MSGDPLTESVEATLAAHPEHVARWRAREAGAWGYLAGQGILAYRSRLGRSLTEAERRHLWAALWSALEGTQ